MEHQRIDEGLPRKPKRRNGKITHPSNPADLGTWVIPTDLDPDAVLQQYLSESTTAHIASQYGLSRKALTRWLRQQRPNEWREIQALRAFCTKEDAQTGLTIAPDALSLSRARELLRSAQFDLQALDPDWRPKQELSGNLQPIMNITVVSSSAAMQQLPISDSKRLLTSVDVSVDTDVTS